MNNTGYHQQIVFGFTELFISIWEKCTIQRVLKQSRLFSNVCFTLKRLKRKKNHLQATVLKFKTSYKSGYTSRWRVGSQVRKEDQRSYLIFIIIMTGSRLNRCLFTCPHLAFLDVAWSKTVGALQWDSYVEGKKLLWVLSQSRCKFNYCALSLPSCLGVLGKQL